MYTDPLYFIQSTRQEFGRKVPQPTLTVRDTVEILNNDTIYVLSDGHVVRHHAQFNSNLYSYILLKYCLNSVVNDCCKYAS